jgi:DNA-binding NarL/FixJ family response regulator
LKLRNRLRSTSRSRGGERLPARGRSNAEISAEFVVEESTVKKHVKRILMKLHARDRVQAAIFASRGASPRGPVRTPALTRYL